MAKSSQLDSQEFKRLDFPYNRVPRQTDDDPRIVNGKNIFIPSGNKIKKRPGTIHVPGLDASTIPARFLLYETLDSNPYIYFLASFEDTPNVWTLKYADLDTPTAWTSVGTLRQVAVSTAPHEMVVHKGRVYIKGFPSSASGEKLGTVVWEATGGVKTLRFWGAFGPTEPAHVTDPASWSITNTDHGFAVLFGWKYAYSYVTSTGQVTNHSLLETNPDLDPSDTGNTTQAATTGFCPEVVVVGQADTTNIPFINIYRTTDGGGTFFFLEQIANTGAGNITFVDKFLGSGGSGTTFKDPIPDTDLDITRIAPQDNSNDPPPPVIPPSVANVDQPAASTKIVSWQGRLWYAVGHFLFFSAVEEIGLEGIGEECWPGTAAESGLVLPSLRGNYFQCQYPITNISYEEGSLYIHTRKITYRVTGTLKETFNMVPFVSIGSPPGHPRATAQVNEQAVWLTHDYRIAMAGPDGYKIVSDELYTDLVTAAEDGAEFELTYWAELDKDYLFVIAHRSDDPRLSQQWVLDIKRTMGKIEGETRRTFWFTPWTIRSVVACEGRTARSIVNRRMLFGVWEPSTFSVVKLDSTEETVTDYLPVSGNTGYTWRYVTHQHQVPAGNHLNTISKPHREPAVHRVIFERNACSSDVIPRMYYYLDDFYNFPIPVDNFEEPPRRRESIGYRTNIASINTVCRRFAFLLSKTDDAEAFEQYNYTVVWNAGAGT